MKALHAFAVIGFLAVATFLAGCDDGDSTGVGSLEGLRFSFSGDTAGSFEAAGTPVVTAEGRPEFGDWAISAEPDSLGGIVIASFRATEDPRGDLFVLQLGELRTGEFSPCESNADCHGRVFFGVNTEDFSDFEHYFEIVSGSVTITALGEGRLSGSFEFTARDEGGTGARTLTVDDGQFDVPFATTEESGAVRCMTERTKAGSDAAC